MATGDDVNDGIDFQDDGAGTVTNHTGGSIIGAHHGITGSQGVTVVNELGGTIIGSSGSAVNIDNNADVANTVTVTNYGVMLGNANAAQEDSDGDAIDVDGLLKLDNYGYVAGTGANGHHDEEVNVSEGIAAGGARSITTPVPRSMATAARSRSIIRATAALPLRPSSTTKV